MRGPPIYREFAPREALRGFVHCIWTFAGPPDRTPQPIAPDGRPELIVHCRCPYHECAPTGIVVQPPLLFAGQLTKPLALVATSDVAVVGVRFRPDGARAFIGCGVDAATDRRLDLATLHGQAAAALHQTVRAAANLGEAAQAVEDYVAVRLPGAEIDAVVRQAVTDLMTGGERRAPEGLSARQFQRRFKSEVGVSPRML